MIAKFAIPAAALAALVAADDCSFSSATTVTDAQGASKIAACTSVSGDVAFAQGAANPTVSLTSLEKISGKLDFANDPTVSAFFAPKLTEVGGAITFKNCSMMGQISLPALKKSGDVTLVNLGGLSSVTTGTQYSEAGTVTIGNTQLQELGGFGNLSKITGIDINGNNLLSDVTMNIGMVDVINIGNNEQSNQGLKVSFSNLTTAKNITVQKAANLNFDSLQHVEGTMNIQNGTFSSFSAPNLTYVGALYLSNNAKMSNISLPQLTDINGTSAAFGISNNTALQTVGGFPNLQNIQGALIWAGDFSNFTGLDSLKLIKGAVKIQSTEVIDDLCKKVSELKSSQVIRVPTPGCSGKVQGGQSTGTSGSGGGSGTGSGSSSSSGAAGTVDIPTLPALSAGLGAFLLQFLLSF